MARKLRFIPEGGALVEVTCRTIQGRFLLRPSPELNKIILGVLGKAQSLYPLEIVAYVWMSTHFHLLLWVEDAHGWPVSWNISMATWPGKSHG